MRKMQFPLVVVLWISGLTTAFGAMPWLSSLQEAQQIAQRDQRLILLHFYTDWCGPCQRLEQQVFPRPDVQQTILTNYVAVKINAEKSPDLARYYQVDRYPTDIIADNQGRVISRMVTPSDPGRYMQILNDFAARSQPGATGGQSVAQGPAEGFGPPTGPWDPSAADRRGDWQPPAPAARAPITEAAYPSQGGMNDRLPQIAYGPDGGGQPQLAPPPGPYGRQSRDTIVVTPTTPAARQPRGRRWARLPGATPGSSRSSRRTPTSVAGRPRQARRRLQVTPIRLRLDRGREDRKSSRTNSLRGPASQLGNRRRAAIRSIRPKPPSPV